MKTKPKAKNRIKTSKKTKMFLLFLGLSFLIWFPIKLSKLYTDAVYVKIIPAHMPDHQLILNTPTDKITVSVEQMSGFDLLRNRIAMPSISIDLRSLKRLKKNTHYILTTNLSGEIRSELSSDLKLISISPDTLFYELGISKTRKIPVKLDLNLNYESSYDLVDELVYTPKEIEISGPENLIDTITMINSEAVVLSDIKEDISISVPILKFLSNEISYGQTDVSVLGTVEKFTESRMKLPFEIVNKPANVNITTIPTEIEIVFKVPQSRYKSLKPTDFKITCDYNRSKLDNLSYLIPEIQSRPSYVRALKMIPEQIEYFITE